MMIPYNRQFIDNRDIKFVSKILKSKNLTQGNMGNYFEKALKKKFKSKHCSVLSNGTAALHLAIKALNIKKGKKIITTPITFISTVSSILMNNLVPTFADIDKKSFTLDPNQTEDLIKKDKNIKAIIGVDYAGHPCDWQALKFIKKKYNVKLINDNCHAMGSKINDDIGYAVKYADLVTHSYHAIKNFTTGEGGSVLTNNSKYFKTIMYLRSHNVLKEQKDLKKFGSWFYKVKDYGFNYRLTDFQSALGISQLKKLNIFIGKRRKNAQLYDKLFNKENLIETPEIKKGVYHSYHLYPVLIDFKKLKIDKKIFFSKMLKKKINLQVHYQPLHYQPFIKKFLNQKKNYLENSEDFYEKEVSLPNHYLLNDKQINFIYQSIKKELNII